MNGHYRELRNLLAKDGREWSGEEALRWPELLNQVVPELLAERDKLRDALLGLATWCRVHGKLPPEILAAEKLLDNTL